MGWHHGQGARPDRGGRLFLWLGVWPQAAQTIDRKEALRHSDTGRQSIQRIQPAQPAPAGSQWLAQANSALQDEPDHHSSSKEEQTMTQYKYLLEEKDMPTRWYNLSLIHI